MNKETIRRNIKANAKTMMNGRWGSAIGILFISLFVSIVCIAPYFMMTFVSGIYYGAIDPQAAAPAAGLLGGGLLITYLLEFFLLMPFLFGVFNWYFNVSRGEAMPVSAVFDYFGKGKLYSRSIKVTLGYFWRVFLWTLLPMAVIMGCMVGFETIGKLNSNIPEIVVVASYILGVFLMIAAYIFIFYICIKYAMYMYTSVRNKEWNNKQVFDVSVKYMKGHRWEYFVFCLSFFWWYLLGAVTCYIALIWVVPYFKASQVLFFNYLYDVGAEGDKPSEDMPYSDRLQDAAPFAAGEAFEAYTMEEPVAQPSETAEEATADTNEAHSKYQFEPADEQSTQEQEAADENNADPEQGSDGSADPKEQE